MSIKYRSDLENINWNAVSEILKTVGMGYYEAQVHKKAFENSFCVVFAFDGEKMIGFGRMISDGAYQAAAYDIAVQPEYQGRGIGRAIVEKLMEKIPGCNVILYASPGKEQFYEKFGFRRMKTGMAFFQKSEFMREKGFTE